MSEELERVESGIGAASGEGASPIDTQPSGATGADTFSPDVQAHIEATVKARAQELEKELARIKYLSSQQQSGKDKELKALREQLRAAQQNRVEEAQALLPTNPERAAELLMRLAQEQSEQIERDGAHDELVSWQHGILADLGADPEEDEEAATLAMEWGPKILANPDYVHDYHQEAAKLAQRKVVEKAVKKAVEDTEERMRAETKAEVTRQLVASGILPEPTGEGGAPPSDDDWRKLSPAQMREKGLAERAKRPLART